MMPNENEEITNFISSASSDELLQIVKAQTPEEAMQSLLGARLSKLPNDEARLNWLQNNLLTVRREAYLAYVKENLHSLKAEEVNAIMRMRQINELKNVASNLIGQKDLEQGILDSLFTSQPSGLYSTTMADRGFFNHIRAIVAAEATMRWANQPEMSVETILGAVNSPNPIPNPQRDLVQSLPDKERHELEAQLAEIFVRKYSPTTEEETTHLFFLLLTKDENQFKQHLSRLGIKYNAWVDNQTMAAIQKDIALKFANKYKEFSGFGPDVRPELVNFMRELSPEQQQSLINEPQKLAALMHAKNLNELPPEYPNKNARKLFAENARIDQLAKINNAGIARMLAKSNLPFLSAEKIDKINTILMKNEQWKIDFTKIIDVVEPSKADIPRIASAFTDAQDIYFADTQYERNKWLRLKQNDAIGKGGNSVVLDYFLNLEKKETILKTEIDNLLEDFVKANTYQEFLNSQPATYREVLTRDLSEELTEEDFNKLKLGYQQTEELYRPKKELLSDSTYKDHIKKRKEDVKKLEDLFAKVEKADKGFRKSLPHFKNSLNLWLVGGDTAEKLRYLQPIAADIDTIYEELKRQNEVYEKRLRELPTIEEVKLLGKDEAARAKAIEEYRKYLTKGKEKVERKLADYQGIQDFLHGDQKSSVPFVRDGALKTLEKATKDEASAIQFRNFNTSYEDVKRGEEEKGENLTTSSSMEVGNSSSIYYRLVNPIPKDHKRHHTISFKTGGEGKIIEERNPPDVKKKAAGVASAKITLKQFPTTTEGQVATCLCVASQLLANGIPDKNHKVSVKGPNAIWIYAALRFVGIPENAIDTRYAKGFDPKLHAGNVKGILKEFKKYKGKDDIYIKGAKEILKHADRTEKKAQEIGRHVGEVEEKLGNKHMKELKLGLNKIKNDEVEKKLEENVDEKSSPKP